MSSLTKFRRTVINSIKLWVLFSGSAIVVASGIITHPGTVHADTSCSPNGVTLNGSSWLSGGGVNVCNNGSSSGDDYGPSCVPVSGAPGGSGCSSDYVYAAEEWQCVELVNRLYLTKGWTNSTWWGNGNTLVNNVPSGPIKQNNGSISYVNAGDVITLDDGGYGHGAIINTISGNTVNIINQNAQLNSAASITSGSLSSTNAYFTMSGWAGYYVQSIIHHPTSGGGGPSLPLRIGALDTSGTLWQKKGA